MSTTYAQMKPHLARKQQRVRRFVDAFKLTVGCTECGYRDNPAALELDHIDPVEENRAWSTPLSWRATVTRLLDLDTQVLCANHHRIKSVREQEERMARLAGKLFSS